MGASTTHRRVGFAACAVGIGLLLVALASFAMRTSAPAPPFVSTAGLDSLSLLTHEEAVRTVIIHNRATHPIRLINESGLGCDSQLCTSWEAALVAAIAAGERREVPFRVVVHRAGAFERVHRFFYEGEGTLWEVTILVRGTARAGADKIALDR